LFLCALVTITAARPSVADETLPPEAQSFVGTWVHSGGDAEEQARLDAIEVVAEAMPAMFRSMVRSKLTENVAIIDSLTIEASGDQLAIGVTDGESLPTPLDGSTVELQQQGKTAQVTRELVDGALRSHVAGARGWTTSVYRVSEDGRTLTVTRETGSDRLAVPLEFEATYTRQ